MQLTLTDYEANLIERALRRQTGTFSDMDDVAVKRIADRILREIIHAPVPVASKGRIVDLDSNHAGYMFTTGEKDFLSGDAGERRWAAAPNSVERSYVVQSDEGMRLRSDHYIRREADEYACSCGARWDVSDGDEHP